MSLFDLGEPVAVEDGPVESLVLVDVGEVFQCNHVDVFICPPSLIVTNQPGKKQPSVYAQYPQHLPSNSLPFTSLTNNQQQLTCPGRDGEPHGPRCEWAPRQAEFPEAAGPQRFLSPNESSLWESRCSGAGCPEWIAPNGLMKERLNTLARFVFDIHVTGPTLLCSKYDNCICYNMWALNYFYSILVLFTWDIV